MMKKVEVFDKNVLKYDAWYDKYPFVFESEVEALRTQLLKLPENIHGIEVGLGTGRFSQALGIREGIEPSQEMAEIALSRGIEVIQGFAESLPYKDLHFDFVLFVTLCYLESVTKAFKEAHRVLKNKGVLIIGFLDAEGKIGSSYHAKRKESTFYRNARFRNVKVIQNRLENCGFKDLEFSQTLFGELDDIKTVQFPKPGYGEGSFVVIKAVKR